MPSTNGRKYFSDPMYDASGYILQKDAMIKTPEGVTPVIGSWVIGSVFVPHIFI